MVTRPKSSFGAGKKIDAGPNTKIGFGARFKETRSIGVKHGQSVD